MSRAAIVSALALAGCRATAVASSESSSSGDASSSTSDACAAPPSDAVHEVVVRLRNDSGATRWVTRWSCMFPFDLFAPDGSSIQQAAQGRCDDCDDVLTNDCEPWCEDHCDGVTVRIEPGATYEATWGGRVRETITLACAECNAMCDVAHAAPGGAYRVSLRVHDACDAMPSTTCECTPDENGICEIWDGPAVAGEGVEIEQTFVFPEELEVELVVP